MADKKKVLIIGGGAAGFFTAANLDETKFDVIILEQQADVLQKVKISGGGRCNVTHGCFDPKELVQFYPRGNKELLGVFHHFQPGDTMAWFEERNVPLKIEEDNRVFPQSNSSQTIIETLKKEIHTKGFKVLTKKVVLNIEMGENACEITTKDENFNADFIVYTTGSAPKSLQMIEKLGHKIVAPVPSLFTFNIKNKLLEDLPGTSFPFASVQIPSLKLEESGPLLITHWGLSGPAVLKLSAWGARKLAEINYETEIVVNFLGVGKETAEEIFQKEKVNQPKKTIGQAKIFEITSRFWNKVLELAQIRSDKQLAHITANELKSILHLLCENRMKMKGKSTFKDEFVTAGGVELKEINFKNMRSRILPNFYLAGEVLNIDAVTGGFNFQACWSEAWLIAQDLNENF